MNNPKTGHNRQKIKSMKYTFFILSFILFYQSSTAQKGNFETIISAREPRKEKSMAPN
jgi:hypothetical protein